MRVCQAGCQQPVDAFVTAAKTSRRKISESAGIPQRKGRKRQRESLEACANHTRASYRIEGTELDKRAQNEQDAIESRSEILGGVLKVGDTKTMGRETDASEAVETMQQVSR